MRLQLTMAAALLTAMVSHAGTVSVDSVAVAADSIQDHVLQEVVVEARTQRVIDKGVAYMPSKRARQAAIDAVGLLRLMNIPQLDITPGSMSVKTMAGKDVAMFIDYLSATEADLNGLRPEDVLRIEVLEYPDDPRFNSQPNVVNFIMRKLEWGGYTKLTATGNTLNVDRLDGTLYSKFVYKDWTFDANAGSLISYNGHTYGSSRHEVFRDVDFGGRHYDVIDRYSASCDGAVERGNSQWTTLRASYRTDATVIVHSVSFFRSATPTDRDVSMVTFTDDVIAPSKGVTDDRWQTLSPSIRGYYFFRLPKDNTLLASWSFNHGGTRRNSSYALGALSPIVNGNSEESYSPNLSMQYSKKLRHNNTFRTSLMSYNTWFRTGYSGSYNGCQRLLSSENMMFLEYMQAWNCGINLYSRVGVSYVLGRVNGDTSLEQWNPRLGFQLSYKINDRHSASFEGWWGNSHPHPSTANSALVQSNELLWLQGNPDMRNTLFVMVGAHYNFIPCNVFSMSAAAEYEGNPSKPAWEFFTMAGHDGVIRRQINSGDFHSYSAWLSGTLKLFDNSLSVNTTVKARRVVLTGVDAQSDNMFSAKIQAGYYLKKFVFTLYYQSPQTLFGPWQNGVRYRHKSTYGLEVGFNTGNFKLSAQFNNWFDSNRLYEAFDSPYYSVHGWMESEELSRSLSLTLSYTLPYGKKVNQGNELDNSGGSNSAILK